MPGPPWLDDLSPELLGRIFGRLNAAGILGLTDFTFSIDFSLRNSPSTQRGHSAGGFLMPLDVVSANANCDQPLE